jgi:hypothetical protein
LAWKTLEIHRKTSHSGYSKTILIALSVIFAEVFLSEKRPFSMKLASQTGSVFGGVKIASTLHQICASPKSYGGFGTFV